MLLSGLRRKVFVHAAVLTTLFLAALPVPRANAQVLYGSIVGNVLDPTGSVVVGAQVRLTNSGTMQSDTVVTNDAGLFTFQNVIAGTYNLTVSATGFKASTQEGIPVNANTLQRRDMTLQIGQSAESVSVEALALTLQTDSGAVSSEMTAKEVTEIPLGQYRNYQSLELLVPGATPPRFQNARTDTPQRTLTVNMNGTDRQSNTTKIDGAVSMNIAIPSQNAYIPGADTIEAVNIVTNAFDAEQGGTGGSAITVTTKSGTNALHGSAYANQENSIIGARDFFDPGKVTPKELLNIAGGTVGGAIRKDKLFFFAGFETNRERANIGTRSTIPTADQRIGNFSAYPGTVIYNPFTGDAAGRGRIPFNNNIIPPNLLDPIALKLQSFIPNTNLPGISQNYYSSGDDVENRDQYDLKINYNRNNLRTFFKYGLMNALTEGKGSLGNGLAPGGGCNCSGGAGQGNTLVQTATIGQTYVISPNLVYDGSEGYTRMALRSLPELYGTNFGSQVLGIPGTNGSDPGGDDPNWATGMPTFTISGYSTLGDRDTWNPVFRKDQTPTTSHNLTWIKGKHDLRFGFDALQFRMNYAQGGTGGPKGTVNWTGGTTQLNGGPAATQLNSWASFLLGLPASYQKGNQWENYIAYEYQFGLYVRDRWQINQKLTLSYGLRWEKYPLFSRAAGRPGIEEYDPVSNIITLGGVGGNSKDLGVTTSNKLFAPRLGIAYRLNDKTVIRTGYGISIDPASMGRQLTSYPLNVGNTFNGANSFVSYGPLETGFPTILGPPPGTATVAAPLNASIVFIAPKTIKRGYIQSWNFIVERQLPWQIIANIGYVATESTDMRYQAQINNALPGTGNAGLPLFAAYGRIASTTALGGGLSSNYHSLQAAFSRRISGGLTLKGAFTYSKAMGEIDDAGGQLFFTLPGMMRRNYAVAAFDQPIVYSTAFVYEMPFGTGKKYLNTGIAAKILGGWQWNGILAAFSGRPFTVQTNATSLNAPNSGTQTANQVCASPTKIGTVEQWYDGSCFTAVTTAAFGNTNRNILRGPGVVNLDTSLFRQFKVTERVQLQFRFEGFNIANTAHFNPPNDAAPNGNPFTLTTAADYMKITTTLGPPGQGKDAPARYFRAGLRFTF